MRDAATPSDDGHDAPPDSTPTPQQRAAAIRAAAAEVLTRVQEWRNSPHWRDDYTSHHWYQVTMDTVAKLDKLPDPDGPEAVAVLDDAVRPILATWRPSRPGPQQAIYAAVERLRQIVP